MKSVFKSSEIAHQWAHSQTTSAQVTLETYLPVFPGFYGTIFGDEDGERERRDLELLFGDLPHAAELARICDGNSDLYEIDYRQRFTDYTAALTRAVSAELENFPGVEALKFQGLRSPREYNFANDAGDVELVLSDERRFRAALLRKIRANRAEFAEFIQQRYTSGPGFWSHYSNDPRDWTNDIRAGIDSLDGHKAGALLDFVLNADGFDEEALYYAVEEPGYVEYMRGPLINLLDRSAPDLPPAVLEILDTIEAGRRQLEVYGGIMRDRNPAAIDNQRRGLAENERKLYTAAVRALADAADESGYINEDGAEYL